MRRLLIGMLAIAATVGSLSLFQRRGNGRPGEQDPVQWPFDPTELQSLMANVVAEQRARVMSIEDEAGRNRAQAFLDYYERRRQAAAS